MNAMEAFSAFWPAICRNATSSDTLRHRWSRKQSPLRKRLSRSRSEVPMAGTNLIPDGNDEIEAELSLIIEIIARIALWVHPQAFHALPVWCPWTARGRPLYDKTWQQRATNTRRDSGVTSEKFEANVAAGKALVAALGV